MHLHSPYPLRCNNEEKKNIGRLHNATDDINGTIFFFNELLHMKILWCYLFGNKLKRRGSKQPTLVTVLNFPF